MGALQLWLLIKPVKRIREWRAAKRAEKAAENQVSENVPVEAAPAAEDGAVSELGKSMGRSALKILGTALATYAAAHGLIDPSAGDAFYAALEAAAGGVATLVGLYLSHRTHAKS